MNLPTIHLDNQIGGMSRLNPQADFKQTAIYLNSQLFQFDTLFLGGQSAAVTMPSTQEAVRQFRLKGGTAAPVCNGGRDCQIPQQ